MVTVITGQEELGAKLEEEQKAQNEWRGKTTKKAKREERVQDNQFNKE